MNTPFFSIIVPACNTAPWADRLCAAITEQTDPDFECIVVNEESTDGTAGALHAHLDGDPRCSIVALPRSGSASESRNYGIRHARGEWLLFIDGDDWFEKDSLQKFRAIIQDFPQVDVISAAASVWQEKDGGSPEYVEAWSPATPERTVMSGREALSLLLNKSFQPATWLRIYRRTFLLENQLFQVPGRRHQDDEWSYRVLFAANWTVSVNYRYYNYLKRAGSVTTKPNPKSMTDVSDNLRSFFLFYENHRQEMPQELRRGFAKWTSEFLLRFFLYTHYDRDVRRRKFERVCKEKEDFRRYRSLAVNAKLPYRILIPLMFLARFRYGFPAVEWLCGKIYWPLFMFLIKRRMKAEAAAPRINSNIPHKNI